jgi:hypothetical protein
MSPGYQGTLSSDPSDHHSHKEKRVFIPQDLLGKDASSLDPIDDEKILEKIEKTLNGHTEFDSSRIQVEVKNSRVLLMGLVDSAQTKATIEGLSESVQGVQEVVNNIQMDNISNISKSMSGQDDLSIQPD